MEVQITKEYDLAQKLTGMAGVFARAQPRCFPSPSRTSMLIRDLPDHYTDKTRLLADVCLEFSVSLSSTDDPSGEICQTQWKNESGPDSRVALPSLA